jgi:hypothetical protein
MKRHALLGTFLVACGGGTAATTTPATEHGGADCHQAQALQPPGKRDNAPGYRAGVVCEDGACELTVSHEGVTRSFALETAPGESLVGVRRDDLDGDGTDELMVLATVTHAYGPSGEMEIIERSLTIVDAASLELRWSTPAWSSEPPEPQSAACTSTAELRDEDCDGRRETLVETHRCDAPMCADVRAGKPADSDYVRDECGARGPAEEVLTFRAATAGGAFTAAAH